MKRTFSILLLILLVTYAKEGYELVTREAPVKCSVKIGRASCRERV